MIEHRMAIFLLFVLLLMRSASWGQDDREGEQVNHTGNTQPPDASFHYWTGQIKQDTTWRDTVYVGGDVTVVSGATLTLAPETQVHFLPYRDDTQGGLDSTRAELIVEGRLHAQAEGIVFCSANAASLGADWYGIVVKRGGLADVSNATIRDGLRCLYAKRGGRVAMDHIAFDNCGKPTQVEPADSLMVKEKPPFFDIEDKNLRIFAKTGAGIITSAASIAALIGVFSWVASFDDERPDERNDIGSGIGILIGSLFTHMFGTPIGVTLVDPHDSPEETLRWAQVGGWGGLGVGVVVAGIPESLGRIGGFAAIYLGPVVGSIYGSDKSRHLLSAEFESKPQDHRISFGLSPTSNGGLSASATLHF